MIKGTITQIGSLPHEDPSEALEYSMKHPIPFLPELTKRGETMLEYIRKPGTLACLDEFKRNRYKTVKAQCIGPETLITSGQGYSEEEAIRRIYEHTVAIIDGLEAEDIIFFLDEPSLGQSGIDYQSLWSQVFEAVDIEHGLGNVTLGVHTCIYMDWDQLLKSGLGVISFDASMYDITSTPKYVDEYRKKKRISWGIKDSNDIRDFRPGDLITPPCGLGSGEYSVSDCDKWLKRLQEAESVVKRGPNH